MSAQVLYIGSAFTLEVPDSPAQPRVVLKYPTASNPPPLVLAALEREYRVGASLDIPGVRRVLRRTRRAGRPALELEHIQGETFESYFRRDKQRPLEAVLRLALSAAEALESLHASGVVHRDLAADNLLVSSDEQRAFIIDLDFAMSPGSDDSPVHGAGGHLPYLPPEQTGRIDLPIDERSDLYSFGVVLYEMLTGTLPFEAEDRAGWIHAHIARTPEPPSDRAPSVPRAVSDVVLRLLEKTPDNRYQTARGLAHDLRYCLTSLPETGAVRAFPLGRDDLSGRLRSPRGLFGREAEQERLRIALQRASAGEPGVLFVSGFAGVGKTALVSDLRFPVASQGGHFIEGKFDRTLQTVPYSAFAEAFTQLCHQLLAGTREELESFRERVLDSLGRNAGLLLELVPEFESIIGPQPPPSPLDTAGAANRFAIVLLGFFHCMVTAERPLTLFLDDAQWADAASLDLLHLLVTRTVCTHFLILCAFRDNELASDQPLPLLIDRLKKEWKHVDHLRLRGLTVEQSGSLLAETLGVSPDEARLLSTLIHRKTDGNPFFTRQVLESLVHDGALRYDAGAGAWSWAAARVNAQDISDNVIELMLRKVARLPAQTRDLLQVAACIGNAFSIDLLAAVSRCSDVRQIGTTLAPAVQAGLVAYLEKSARFTHDRIHQAIYESLAQQQAQRVHLKLGRHLAGKERTREHLLATVEQLNLGSPLIDSTREAVELARLNLEAGHTAKVAMAYASAQAFYRRGRDLLECRRATEPALDFELRFNEAEVEFFLGDVDSSTGRLRGLLADAPDARTRMSVYELLIDIDTIRLEVAGAMKTGIEALESLEIAVPSDPSGDAVRNGVAQIDELLLGRGEEELDELPEMTDEQDLAVVSLMAHVVPAAYISSDPMFYPLAIDFARRALRGGLSRHSSFALATYATLLGVVLRRYEDACDVGGLALAISDRADNAGARARINFLYGVFIKHWCAPLESTLPYLDTGWKAGIENGDLQFASYCLNHLHGNGLLAGQSLAELEASLARLADVDRTIRQESGQHVFSMLQRTVQALRHPAGRLPDLAMDHGGGAIVATWWKNGSASTLSQYYLLNCLLAVTFGRSEEALAAAQRAESVLGGVDGMTWVAQHRYLHALALSEAARGGRIELSTALARIGLFRDELREWADHSPGNYSSKLLLVEAELRDLEGAERHELVDAYDAAIVAAVNAERSLDHALACERAAGCWSRRGSERFAGVYLQEALEVYRAWGADAKTAQMLRDNARLLAAFHRRGSDSNASTSSEDLDASDLESVLNAAQAVAGELVLDRMLARLIALLVETAGAQTGHFLLVKEGTWCVVAEHNSECGDVEVLQWQPLEQYTSIASSVVQYVARTKNPVNLDDASKSTIFAADSSVAARGCRSILCLPIVNRGELGGILYLENNLSPRAFTRTHTRVLQLLANQVLSSVEISRYYSRVQALEEQLTQAQKLESIGRLAGGIAHDINNMLAPILGYAELLQLRTPSSDPRRADLDEILRSAKCARDISRQLLAFARKQPLDVKALDLNDVVGGLERMLRRTIRENIIIETDYEATLGSVKGDSALIEQALLNLAVNAQDAMPEGGRLMFETAATVLDAEAARRREGVVPGVYARVSVSDTGVGMDGATLARAFDPFFTTKGVGQGTGLGLSMVYGVVRQHGGYVDVKSAPGSGAAFTLHFPMGAKAPARVQESPVTEVTGGDETILVVEDQPVVLELTSRMLSSKGYTVLAASSPAAALRRAETFDGRIHLLVTDIIMPGMDGRQLYEALRSLRPGTEVIYLSGYPADMVGSHAELPDGNHFLQKPVSLNTLARTVREALDRPRTS